MNCEPFCSPHCSRTFSTRVIKRKYHSIHFSFKTKNSEQFVLLPTPEALALNLENFKLLAEKETFSTIVTNITVEGLDQMKKLSKDARDATRYV